MHHQLTTDHLLCCSTWYNKMEMTLMVETDPSEIINELIKGVRKGGRIGVVGVYAGYANHYNIGGFMVCCVPLTRIHASQSSSEAEAPSMCTTLADRLPRLIALVHLIHVYGVWQPDAGFLLAVHSPPHCHAGAASQ
jgi:threonine dehydrogenase-like Zn-dependent dehydrogenase